MKSLISRLIVLLLAAAVVTPLPAQQGQGEEALSKNLDLAFAKVENAAARELLGSDVIRVRRRESSYMPSGEVVLGVLEVPTEAGVRQQLQETMARHSPGPVAKQEPERQGSILIARAGEHRYWASLKSAAYKFTDTRESMVAPSQLQDFKEAVQVALGFIAEQKVVQLMEAEMIDVIAVSAVRSVVTEVGKERAPETRLSDYYVVFGRRLQDIPVVGSRLVVRLNGKGEVAALQRTWRPLSAETGVNVPISKMTLEQLIVRDPRIREFSEKPLKPEEITVVSRRCGYLEAPANYRQTSLRPGCIVSFRIGEQFAESYPQLTIPLEEGVQAEQLWETGTDKPH